jgi:integrase
MQKYFDFIGGRSKLPKGKKQIEEKILEYIAYLKKKGASYHTISISIAPVKSFYAINDVIINTKKIGKFMPEYKKKRTDKPYTHSQIEKLLEISDERMRCVILILASSGIRLGAVPSLRLKDLDNQKLTVYSGDREEYFTFITAECKKAIDNYLDMRLRYGEKLTDDSYLIREQFDVRCPGKPKAYNRKSIQTKLYDLCKRAGIDKKDIPLVHGFRKFFTGQLINSNVRSEARLKLEGHSIGITDHYWRPTEQEMYFEYEKAVDNLTIDPAQRLRKKVETLTIEKSKADLALTLIAEMKERIDMK